MDDNKIRIALSEKRQAKGGLGIYFFINPKYSDI